MSLAEKGLCVGSCIRQCVCSSATYSIDESAAAIAPISPKPGTKLYDKKKYATILSRLQNRSNNIEHKIKALFLMNYSKLMH